MISISSKELRNNFSVVIEQLKKGSKFLLIHNSVPVAEIHKPTSITHFSEASDEDIQSASIKDISEEYISEEELDYYSKKQNKSSFL